MSYPLDIKNNNAKNGHWLDSPKNTITTGEQDRSKEYDLNYLKHLIRVDSLVPFYQSKLWEITRYEVMKRDFYECQRCKYNKVLTTYHPEDKIPMYIHHICELKKYPELCLNQAILVTLCWNCHEEIHGRIKRVEPDVFLNFDSSEIV